MNEMREDKGLAFFGRVTASVSHEMNNVLAIVNELAGLVNDLLYGLKQGDDNGLERLGQAAEGIQKQIRRGEEIVKRMNRFAHSVDDPISEFDLHVVIADMAAMAQRRAALKGVRFETMLCQEPIMITGVRFEIQRLAFAGFELASSALAGGGTVSIASRRLENLAEISITAAAWKENGDVLKMKSELSADMRRLNGTLFWELGTAINFPLVLSFPIALSVEKRGQ
ncbi:MAG: hypothetical protein AB1656_21935 [Candidatus Omnitrophota bacterium]